MKDVQKGDSLKLRYKELQLKTIGFSNAVIQLVKKNDSLDKRESFNNLKIQQLNTELKTVKQKKGLSVFEGILIGIAALTLGLSF